MRVMWVIEYVPYGNPAIPMTAHHTRERARAIKRLVAKNGNRYRIVKYAPL